LDFGTRTEHTELRNYGIWNFAYLRNNYTRIIKTYLSKLQQPYTLVGSPELAQTTLLDFVGTHWLGFGLFGLLEVLLIPALFTSRHVTFVSAGIASVCNCPNFAKGTTNLLVQADLPVNGQSKIRWE
jgi:hypothetical protein